MLLTAENKGFFVKKLFMITALLVCSAVHSLWASENEITLQTEDSQFCVPLHYLTFFSGIFEGTDVSFFKKKCGEEDILEVTIDDLETNRVAGMNIRLRDLFVLKEWGREQLSYSEESLILLPFSWKEKIRDTEREFLLRVVRSCVKRVHA